VTTHVTGREYVVELFTRETRHSVDGIVTISWLPGQNKGMTWTIQPNKGVLFGPHTEYLLAFGQGNTISRRAKAAVSNSKKSASSNRTQNTLLSVSSDHPGSGPGVPFKMSRSLQQISRIFAWYRLLALDEYWLVSWEMFLETPAAYDTASAPQIYLTRQLTVLQLATLNPPFKSSADGRDCM
jgi:hypothetical protein